MCALARPEEGDSQKRVDLEHWQELVPPLRILIGFLLEEEKAPPAWFLTDVRTRQTPNTSAQANISLTTHSCFPSPPDFVGALDGFRPEGVWRGGGGALPEGALPGGPKRPRPPPRYRLPRPVAGLCLPGAFLTNKRKTRTLTHARALLFFSQSPPRIYVGAQ